MDELCCSGEQGIAMSRGIRRPGECDEQGNAMSKWMGAGKSERAYLTQLQLNLSLPSYVSSISFSFHLQTVVYCILYLELWALAPAALAP